MTISSARWTAGLTAIAATAIAFGAWAKVDTSKLRPANGPTVVSEAARQPASQPGADATDLPEIPAARPSAPPSGPVTRGGDRDGNRISDILESRLGGSGPGERFDVIVVFDRDDPVGRARGAIGDFALGREFSIIKGFQAEMTAAQIRALSALPGVVRIEENIEVQAHDIYANDDTGATAARNDFGPLTGAGVTICVLDTGINPDHELFDSKGLTADDFADFTSTAAPDPYDDHFHGSHVAGIAAGDGTPFATGGSAHAANAIGVAPAANLKVGKVLDANGSGSSAQIIDGLEWCANQASVDIINMSLGGAPTDGTDPISVAANCAADPSGASCGNFIGTPKIVVVSAGNSGAELGTVGTPGVAEKVITVASFAEHSGDALKSWQDDGVYLNPFSSRGAALSSKPDIAGVGSRVLSAYINDPANPSPTSYAVASGTSMSAPHVAGIVALMVEADPSLATWNGTDAADLPYAKVRFILKDTAVDVGPLGEDREYGAGLVDAYAAVATAANSSLITQTSYPLSSTQVSGNVPTNSSWDYPFTIYDDQVGLPVAAMMTIDGQVSCSFWCIITWWDPDLELIVERDTGSGWQQVTADTNASPEVTHSTCPEGSECGGIGRVELVHFIAKQAGNYRFRVYPFDADPNAGKGGPFFLDISMPATDSGGGDPNASPTASFTYDCTDLSCSFDASASSDTDGSIVSYAWDFGDGNSGTGVTTSHSYDAPGGEFPVVLTVTDNETAQGTDSQTVTVSETDQNASPTASFTYDCTDLSCSFDASASSDTDGSIVSYAWDFGDGNSGTGVTTSHSYDAPGGEFPVVLTVTDNETAQGTDSQTVTVSETDQNASPTASFTYDCTDLSCSFDASASSDTDGSIVSYAWDFGDGNSGTGVTTYHNYDAPGGEFPVVLTVTDNETAQGTDSQTVTVSEPAGGDITLSATGYKQRGRHAVDLTWSDATSANVDIYRDGVVVDTVNNISPFEYTDNITRGRGSATYVYEVCEAGTSTCSNEATVVF